MSMSRRDLIKWTAGASLVASGHWSHLLADQGPAIKTNCWPPTDRPFSFTMVSAG